MSHTTTQQTPQWAREAAVEIIQQADGMDCIIDEPEESTLAAIIARHAPTPESVLAACDNLGTELLAGLAAKDAKIARLRDALSAWLVWYETAPTVPAATHTLVDQSVNAIG